jgi:hypothetical protein
VRVFHALPPFSSIALETSSGERFPMELMWNRDDHAGFRFFDMINVQRLLDDKCGLYPKRQICLKTDAEAIIFRAASRSARCCAIFRNRAPVSNAPNA